jgi:hypothetical protein
VQISPVKEIKPIQIMPPTTKPTASAKTPAKPSLTKRKKHQLRKKVSGRKSEAERRIEEIKAEIEKVLARLGQMEIEA